MIDGLGNPDIEVKINTVDHNTFQENITTYLQQPDDLITWFAGYRLRYFADQGLLGDISDVWANLDGFADGFKAASTGDDGKQYFVPLYNYPWAVHYSQEPVRREGLHASRPRWDELIALADQMKADGIIPFALRQRRQVAGDGHVRHPQHAAQRLRLPHQPDGRQRGLDVGRGQERVRPVRHVAAVPPGGRQRAHVAGGGDSHSSRTRPE